MFQFRNMNVHRDKEFLEKFGRNLRKIRQENNLSQEALSDKIEVPRSQISRIERGKGNPTVNTLKRIADVLEVDIELLFQFD
jgi:transcriptional regulator with XRE-family HTH domain